MSNLKTHPHHTVKPSKPTNAVWKNKYSQYIPVKNMSDTYIQNTINTFKKGIIPSNYHGGKKKWLKIFQAELDRRNNG